MDKILEALSKILPEDQVKDISSAVSEVLEEAKKEIEANAQKNLDEAYAQLSAELAEAEKTGEQGYAEAYAIIEDLIKRNESQRVEFEKFLDEQYQKAAEKVNEERSKNSDLESSLYEEYDKKLNDMKEYIVDKVDQFLQVKGREIYEQAKRDVLNDPRMAEHRVVLDKIVELTSDYLSEEDIHLSTSKKVEDLARDNEKLRHELKRHEGRNIRLSTENTKLNSQLAEAVQLIKEHTEGSVINEQKERARKAANVQGKGKAVLNEGEEIIKEHQAGVKPGNDDDDDADKTLVESFGNSLDEMKRLAGIE